MTSGDSNLDDFIEKLELPQAFVPLPDARMPDAGWRAMLDALPAAIYACDAGGRITYYNEAAVALAGRRPQIGSSEWSVTWRLFHLDGRPMPHGECPMAIALKEGRPVRDVEAIAERPDGSRIVFQPFPTPLYDGSGKLTGAVNLLIDVTDRHRSEADAAQLAAIVVSSNDAIASKTLDGIVTSWNEAAERIFGYAAGEMIGQPITRIIPPDLHYEEADILARLRRGERINHYETLRLTKEGRIIHVSLSISPVRDKSGRLMGAAKVARDITQRKQAEETQKLLLGELNHRVKNTLATVQAIASQTLYKARTPAEFVTSFTGRLHALAAAHNVLTQTSWRGAELGALARSQLLTEDAREDCITFCGPIVFLPAQLALHMALVLHELGTNARKHGSLSVPNGRVSLSWSIDSGPQRLLDLRWTESGGPPVYVDAPRPSGFGTQLIERSLHSIEGGEAGMCMEAQGINWTIRVPLFEPIHGTSERAPFHEPASPPAAYSETRPAKRILVVEDEPLIALEVCSVLGTAGYQVAGPVATLEDAMRLLLRTQIDAALLDANLGGNPVDELAAALTRQAIPFTFVSGYGREGLPRAFAEAPMLGKPFGSKPLIHAIARMLDGSSNVIRLRRDP